MCKDCLPLSDKLVRVPEHVARGIDAQRVLPALLATVLVCALAAAPAGASVQNACKYAYDNYYRDMEIDVDGGASIVPAPPRYPSPTGTVVEPGQTIGLDGGAIGVALPSNLPRFGYQAGLLEAGLNTIPTKVWVAVRATNTLEGVRVFGPIAVTATTTIQIDPVTDAYVSDNGFQYSTPSLPDSTWTAVGGDVAFGQAGPGTLGPLPIGAGGALRATSGSVVIAADVAGGVSFVMDCQPGATQDVNPTDGAGATFAPAAATPFDQTISGPRNVTCLSAQGRLVSGAAAGLPTGVTREIDPIGLALSAAGNAATVPPGGTYVLGGAQAQLTLPAATVATLANHEDPPGTPLIVAGKPYPLDLWVTIAGTNTAQGTQTVKVSGSYALTPVLGSPGTWQAYAATIALPATTWTPAAPGPLTFSLAAPGSTGAIAVTGSAASDPLGAPSSASYGVTPYGSAILRAGTERNAATFDCLPGAASVANDAIAFSNLGRLAAPDGSGGRYALLAHPRPPVIASAVALPPPAPPPPPGPATPPAAPPPAAVVPPPPPPAAAQAGPGKVASSRLTVRSGRVRVEISCAGARTTCAGTISLRSAARIRSGGRTRIVTLAPGASYTVAPGRRRTITLRLGREGRSLLAKRRSLRAKVALKPKRGATVTRVVTLRR